MAESSSVCIFTSSFNGVNFGVFGDIGKLSFNLFLLAAERKIDLCLIMESLKRNILSCCIFRIHRGSRKQQSLCSVRRELKILYVTITNVSHLY